MTLRFNLFKATALCMLSLVSSFAMAGGMEGGGGKSVVCRNAQGTITSAELLDLYEGRVAFQLNYLESPKSWKNQSVDILPSAHGDVYEFYNNILDHLNILPEGITLKDTVDSFEVIVPKDCKIEQAAVYQNDNQILVNGEIWKAFSETQKAALIVHESLYRYLREHGESNSIRARHLTAYLFSGRIVEPPYLFSSNDFIGSCYGNGTSFYLITFTDQYGVEKLRLQFNRLNGKLVLSKKFIDLDNVYTLGSGITFKLSDFLRSPLENYTISMREKTKSLFEANDRLFLTFVGDTEPGAPIIQLGGTSSIDESNIKESLRCSFHSDASL